MLYFLSNNTNKSHVYINGKLSVFQTEDKSSILFTCKRCQLLTQKTQTPVWSWVFLLKKIIKYYLSTNKIITFIYTKKGNHNQNILTMFLLRRENTHIYI